jgi:hypothetical protein
MTEDFDPKLPSRGLGDTIAKFTHATGIAKAVEVVTDALGIEDCGCGGRQNWLNEAIPYTKESNPPLNFDPSNLSTPEEGIYEIIHNIHVTKNNQTLNYKVGEKVLINKNHLLYSSWSYYVMIGAVKKIN